MKQGYVYVLSLEDDCYYVGWSQDIQVRICSHFLGAGSKQTQLHNSIDIISIKEKDTLRETLTALIFMVKYGFEKVRGESYTKVEATKPPCCLKKSKTICSLLQIMGPRDPPTPGTDHPQ